MKNIVLVAAPQSASASTPSSIVQLIRVKQPVGNFSLMISQVTPVGNLVVGSPAGDVAYVRLYESPDGTTLTAMGSGAVQINSGAQTRADFVTVQPWVVVKANSTKGLAFLRYEIDTFNRLMQHGQFEFFDIGKSNLGGVDFDSTYNGETPPATWPNPNLSQV